MTWPTATMQRLYYIYYLSKKLSQRKREKIVADRETLQGKYLQTMGP